MNKDCKCCKLLRALILLEQEEHGNSRLNEKLQLLDHDVTAFCSLKSSDEKEATDRKDNCDV